MPRFAKAAKERAARTRVPFGTRLEADVRPIDIDPGMRVRLSELGRKKSRAPDKQGVVVAASRSGTAFRVQWEQQKTADFVHFTLLQACEERRA